MCLCPGAAATGSSACSTLQPGGGGSSGTQVLSSHCPRPAAAPSPSEEEPQALNARKPPRACCPPSEPLSPRPFTAMLHALPTQPQQHPGLRPCRLGLPAACLPPPPCRDDASAMGNARPAPLRHHQARGFFFFIIFVLLLFLFALRQCLST